MLLRLSERLRGLSRARIGVVAIAVFLVVVVAANANLLPKLLAPGGATIQARFADTGPLKVGDEVRIGGVKSGRVERIELDDGGRSATVSMTVFDDAPTLHRDARASASWRTLLGGTSVVQLQPGTPAKGALGDRVIPLQRTTSQVETDQVLSFYRPRAEQGFKRILRETPEAFADPAALPAALESAARTAPSATEALSAVRGRNERGLVPLMRAARRTVQAFDAPDDGLRRLIADTATVTRTTANRQAELRQALQLAGKLQPDVRGALEDLQGTLRRTDPVVERLVPSAKRLGGVLAALRPTVVRTDHLLARARPLARDLRPAATSLATAAARAVPVIDGLRPTLKRTDATILPNLARRDESTKMRTYEIIGPTFASLSGAGATFDADGHLFRFPAIVGERIVSDIVPCSVFLTDPSRSELLACQSLDEMLAALGSFDPFDLGGSR